MKRILTTERLDAYLISRPLAAPCLAYEKRNRELFRPYSVTQKESYYTLGTFQDVCERQERLHEEGRMLPLLFFARGERQHVIASVSLNQIVWGPFRSAKLSYSVDGEHQRKGYGGEAVKAVVEYAFSQLHLHRIEAHIQEINVASLALARALGFQEEGIARGYLFRNGKWIDHLRLSLLNSIVDMSTLN
ncbi:MAG: GNAT family N-acetyltransferase [Sphaerochaeta sp.]